MTLHTATELFEEIINATSAYKGISEEIIRKDYFVSQFLKQYSQDQPEMIFKGGTSLLKCYQMIDRFSEDIDITFVNDGAKLGQGMCKKVNYSVVDVCEKLKFKILNPEDMKSGRYYNMYRVDMGYLRNGAMVRDQIIVEIALQTLAFPIVRLPVHTYITDFLLSSDNIDIIQEYDLQEFEVQVQSVIRTFIDKVFALCDYYLQGQLFEKSRHLYDLYQIWQAIKPTDITKSLVNDVRNVRKLNKKCLSAEASVDINSLLIEIIQKDVYKRDYIEVTSLLLYKELPYQEAEKVLPEILDIAVF